MKVLSISVLGLVVCNLASAGVFKMTFERVSAANDKNRCEAFAAETAKELTKQTGAQVIDVGCVNDGYSNDGLEAVITYQSDVRANKVSTKAYSPYSGALYANFADCSAQLDTQKELFTRYTGLSILAAYCMRDSSLSNARWETRVDGLGTPKLTPSLAAVMLWGTVVDVRTLAGLYATAAKSHGIEVAEVGLDAGGVGRHVVVRYYAPTHFSISDYDDLRYETAEACATAAAATTKILEPTSKPVVTFCEQNKNGTSAVLHVTNFADTLEPVSLFRVIELSTAYATASACEQGLKGLPTVSDAYGGVCAGTKNNFRIHLFTKP